MRFLNIHAVNCIAAVLIAAWIVAPNVRAQTGTIAPAAYQVFFNSSGAVCSGCLLYSYVSGTTTALALYTDAALTVEHPNPVVLNANGRAPNGPLFMLPRSYKLVLRTSAGTEIWSADSVAATPPFFVDLDIQGTAGEALTAGEAVYISASDGRWYRTDADAANTSSTAGMVGMVPASIASGSTGSIRLQGRITGLSGLSIGSLYYASATAGALTASAPSNSRGIGVADSTSTLVLAPNGGNPRGNFTVGGNLLVAGTTTLNGDLAVSSGVAFRLGTTDAADNGSIFIAGGGAVDSSRGAYAAFYGNEHATLPGYARVQIGTAASALWEVITGAAVSALKVTGSTGEVTIGEYTKHTPRASAPSSPASGMVYTDSTPNPDELCFYDGAAWQGISSGTDANCS